MNDKPTCLFCGKPLRKKSHSLELKAGEQVPQTLYGKDVVEILRRSRLSHRADGITERASVWCGDWGNYGDNFFCGLNCGYRWALMRVRLSEKQQPGFVEQFRKDIKKHQESARGMEKKA